MTKKKIEKALIVIVGFTVISGIITYFTGPHIWLGPVVFLGTCFFYFIMAPVHFIEYFASCPLVNKTKEKDVFTELEQTQNKIDRLKTLQTQLDTIRMHFDNEMNKINEEINKIMKK